MCGPKGYGFSAVVVIYRVSISAVLVIYRIWFLHFCLELGIFFEKKLLFQVINRMGKIAGFCHE